MSFTEAQIKALSGKLSASHVRTRQARGLTLSYIEGWHAIAEANRIFGHDRWDRQTMTIKCVWEGPWQGKYTCSYIARVRVRVRAADVEICREGCGSGHGKGNSPGEAHESALKEAETDAMKRALITFGNPFGLALYDKAQNGVRGRIRKGPRANGQAVSWVLLSAEGELISLHQDPVDYCKALRQVTEASSSPERLKTLWRRNAVTVQMLRANLQDLRSEAGEHYADILTTLYKRQLKELHEEAEADRQKSVALQSAGQTSGKTQGRGWVERRSAKETNGAGEETSVDETKETGPTKDKAQANGGGEERAAEATNSASPNDGSRQAGAMQQNCGLDIAKGTGAVDKSALPIGTPRRVRDKGHLRFVGKQPCLVCGRKPGHAHHLRFAQPRAMGRKVSDEWVVPLCATHHRALHTVGDEEKWWEGRGIDPIARATELWEQRRIGDRGWALNPRELIRPFPS